MNAAARLLGWPGRVLAALDERAAAERAAPGYDPAGETARARQILVLAAILLALAYTVLDRPFFDETYGPALSQSRRLYRYRDLISYVYWSAAKLLGFGLIPLLHLRLLGLRLADHGLNPESRAPVVPGARLPWLRTYLILFAGIFPVLVGISHLKSFQDTYPFYRQAGRSLLDFTVWEVSYLLTFVAVEFFFRGYLLFGLRRAIGSLSIFVAVVPYCMIHVNKPLAEMLGSIVAGLLLGTLALSTGSIWCGVLLHVSVALSMDVLASLRSGQLHF